MSETDLVTTALEVLNLQNGVLAMRNALGGRTIRYGLGPGSADIICCVGGTFVALEGKLPGEKQNPDQIIWEVAVKRVGGIYGIFRSVDDARKIVSSVRR